LSVPAAMKLEALQLLHLHARTKEESRRVTDDMLCAIEHFIELHACISSEIDVNNPASNHALLFRKLRALVFRIVHE
jgi:hypothetical protein